MTQRPTERKSTSSLRVGVDLVRVADIAGSIARFGERYTARIFTDAERQYCVEDGRHAAQRFAARFAAKEATMKVLRPSANDGVAWRSIEVCQLPEGACEITLRDAALALATRDGIAELSLSMSHEPEYATATVVARIALGGGE